MTEEKAKKILQEANDVIWSQKRVTQEKGVEYMKDFEPIRILERLRDVVNDCL